ncbi:MAG: hypothetical protein IMZ61_15240 [Planctomycetes bacterium]|nr:hypothetical protein [Planctomycetota bacterium]
MTDNQDIVKQEPQKNLTISYDESPYASFLDTAKFNQIWRVANMFAGSKTVPEHYQGKPNDCFIAFVIAERLRQDPFMFMQKSYVVKGKLGYEAQEIIALANTRGVFQGPIDWTIEGAGKAKKCTAFATMKSDGKVRSSTVSWEMVEAEGWNKNPKWTTMTDHMFKYRSASFLISEVCPEVKMGMYSKEELQDMEYQSPTPKALPVSNLEGRLTKQIPSVQKNNDELCYGCDELFPDDEMTADSEGQLYCGNCFDKRLKKGAQQKATAVTETQKQAENGAEAEKAAKDAADLAEVEGFSKPVAEIPQEAAQDEPQPMKAGPSDVPASERYFCPTCDGTFGKAKGLGNTICPDIKCGKIGIVDRWQR